MLAMSASSRVQDRQRSFKKGIDSDVIRRRREDTTIQIRKTLREDRLNQRRRMSLVVRLISLAPRGTGHYRNVLPRWRRGLIAF